MATITPPSASAQEQYDGLGTRLGELRAELGKVSGELSAVMSPAGIGQLVGTGEPYEKQLARVADLRYKAEALELGILYIQGKISLLERSHYGLRKR